MDPVEIILRIAALIVGVMMVIAAVSSAVVTFVLPRLGRSRITTTLFRMTRVIFTMLARRQKEYTGRDGIMALYAPVSLLLLPAAWLGISLVGFAGIYWAFGVPTFGEAFRESGS